MGESLSRWCLRTGQDALLAQWDTAHNGGRTPADVTWGSREAVWWRCAHGHTWQAQVHSRTHGSGCPVCAGRKVLAGENDLGSRFPEIAAQWHPERNEGLTPQQVSAYANRKVWWRCPAGHDYAALVSSRTRNGSGCPYCAGRKVLAGFNDLAARAPAIAAQWHPTLNGSLTPEDVTVGSRKKVWWQCGLGHSWKAVVYARTGGKKCGCPVCAGVAGGRRTGRYQVWQDLTQRPG